MIDRRVPSALGLSFPHALRMLIVVGAGAKLVPPGGRSIEKFSIHAEMSGNALRNLCTVDSNPQIASYNKIKNALCDCEIYPEGIAAALDNAFKIWNDWTVEERQQNFDADTKRVGCTGEFEAQKYIDFFEHFVLPKMEWDEFLEEAISLGYQNTLSDYSSDATLPRNCEVERVTKASNKEATRIVILRAFGGFGKTNVIDQWLAKNPRSLVFPFYRAGLSDTSTLVSEFEKFLVLCVGKNWDSWDKELPAIRKVRILLEALKRSNFCIVLDGLEVVQSAHPAGAGEGHIPDLLLRGFLTEVCRSDSNWRVLITSRLPLSDLTTFKGDSLIDLELGGFTEDEGVKLLQQLEVVGSETALAGLVVDYEGHPLSLQLVGTLLRDAYGGRVEERTQIEQNLLVAGSNRHTDRAWRILSRYEAVLAQSQPHLLDLIQVISCFSRQPIAEVVRTVARRMETTQPNPMHNDVALKDALAALKRSRLINWDLDPSAFTIHPLIAEYFVRRLAEADPRRLREIHGALCDHYLSLPSAKFIKSAQEAQFLSTAIYHGINAGRQKEMVPVYFDRIQRHHADPEFSFFLRKRLGELDLDLEILSHFFTDRLWDRVHHGIDRAWIQNEAGYVLRGRGRLGESVELFKKANGKFLRDLSSCYGKEFKDLRYHEKKRVPLWARSLDNLVSTYFFLGRLADARSELRKNRRAIRDLPILDYARIGFLAMEGAILHHEGRPDEALAVFLEAEAMAKAEKGARVQRLHSFNGFLYHRLLFDQGDFDQVEDRYENHGVKFSERIPGKLSYGLQEYHHMIIESNRHNQKGNNFDRVMFHANNSMEALGKTAIHLVPYTYVELVRIHRLEGLQKECAEYVRLADEIISNSAQELLIVDLLIEVLQCRIDFGDGFLQQGEFSFSGQNPGKMLEDAQTLSKRCGYGRRARELEEIGRWFS